MIIIGNNQSFKFVDLSITSAKLPFNTHLFIECSDGSLILVDSGDQTEIYKSVDKGANWTQPNGNWSRARTVHNFWHDRDNNRLYWVEATTIATTTYCYYIDLTDDSVNAMGNMSNVGTETGVEWADIFYHDDGGANQRFYATVIARSWGADLQCGRSFFYWNDPNWVHIAGAGWSASDRATSEFDSSPMFPLNGTNYAYCTTYNYYANTGVEWLYFSRIDIIGGGANNHVLYNAGTHVKDLPPTSMTGIAWDGDDLLYFVVNWDRGTSDYRLYVYSIVGVSSTLLSGYKIALMLDRNNSATFPNEFEKAFDVAKDASNNSKIWEIKARKGGLIQLQTINRNANIIAITDNFLMFAGGEMYEYTDILATNTIAEGVLNAGIFPIPTKGRFNCHPDDAHFFYNDDTLKVYDDTDEMILFAKITDKSRDENGIYIFGLDAYTNELYRRSYVKSYTTDNTGEKQRDNLDNACDFCYQDSSIVATATDYSYKQDRPPMAIFGLGRFMERQVGYAEPKGLVWTKAYDGLTKAPQYYKATYNFRDEVVGTSGTDIGFIKTVGANVTAEIIASLNNHKKVLKITQAVADFQYTYSEDFSSPKVAGTIEFYTYVEATNLRTMFYLYDGANVLMISFHEGGNIQYYSGGGFVDTGFTYAANTLYHFKIEFDCAADWHLWIDGVSIDGGGGYAFQGVPTAFDGIHIRNKIGSVQYFDAIGYSWDVNYNIGDNVVAWDVEINGNLDLINIGRDKPSYYVKKLGITRATCVGAAGISQTYNEASLEDGKTILPLKEYRDLRIQATTEALQIATALFNIFSMETTFVGLRVVNQEYVQPGKTVNFANTGDISITEADLLVLFYRYDFIGDVYELMILTDNVALLREFESYLDRSELLVHQNSTAVRENATTIAASGNCFIATGTYTGNNVDNRQITGLGFTPKHLIIWYNLTGRRINHVMDQFPEWTSVAEDDLTVRTNWVKIIADGFEVDNNDNQLNNNTYVYYWTAWG